MKLTPLTIEKINKKTKFIYDYMKKKQTESLFYKSKDQVVKISKQTYKMWVKSKIKTDEEIQIKFNDYQISIKEDGLYHSLNKDKIDKKINSLKEWKTIYPNEYKDFKIFVLSIDEKSIEKEPKMFSRQYVKQDT